MYKYIISGIIQGLTEFLPISSSGHLVLAQRLLGMRDVGLMVVLICHLGTVFSLILFFYKDIIKVFRQPKWLGYILLVTLITGCIGIAGENLFESLFNLPKVVGISLLITGIILISTKRCTRMRKDGDALNLKDAFVLGFAQAFSIIPGISRSGVTISALLFRKLDRQTAFRFSFLAAIPAITGAFLLKAIKAKDTIFAFSPGTGNLLVGFIFSFISGLFSLWILRSIVYKAKLHYFGYYCLAVGILSLVFIK